jgi:hypothetical protein
MFPFSSKWWILLWANYLAVWKVACGASQILNRSSNIYSATLRTGFPILTAQFNTTLWSRVREWMFIFSNSEPRK